MPTTSVPVKEELMEIEAMDSQQPPLLRIKGTENEAMQLDEFPSQATNLPVSNALFGSLDFTQNPSVQNSGILGQKSEVNAIFANPFKIQSANFELSKQNSMFQDNKLHGPNMGSYNGIPTTDTNHLQNSNFVVCGNSKEVLSSSSTTLFQNNLPKKRTYSQVNESQYLSISSNHQSPANQKTVLRQGDFSKIGQFWAELNQPKNSTFTFPSNQQGLPPNVSSSCRYLMPANQPENMMLTSPPVNQQSLSIQDNNRTLPRIDFAACKSLVPNNNSCVSFPRNYQQQIPVGRAQAQINVSHSPSQSYSTGFFQNLTAPGGGVSSSMSRLEENGMEMDIDEAIPSKMFYQRSTKHITSTKKKTKKQQFYQFSQTKSQSHRVVCQQKSTISAQASCLPNPNQIGMDSSSLNQWVVSGPSLPNCPPANASDAESGMDWTEEENSCQTAGVPEVTFMIEREVTECKVNTTNNKRTSLMRKEKVSYKMQIRSAKASHG